ncbi:Glutathione S-transferase [Balamuthia mandrillaris]
MAAQEPSASSSSSSSSALTIHWGSGSPYAWACLIAAEEKGLPYQDKLLSFSEGEHKRPDYLAMNPRGKVPVLTDGPVVLYESQAILHYLEATYPAHPLLPSATETLAKTYTRMAECSYLGSVYQEEHVRAVTKARQQQTDTEGSSSELSAEDIAAASKVIHQEYAFWEEYLKKAAASSSSEEQQRPVFLNGESFSLADASFYPFVALMVRYGFNFEKSFPALHAYYLAHKQRPSIQKTWPPHWKDSPDKNWLSDL